MDSVGKAAARFDFAKLDSINSHYLRAADPAALAQMVMEKLAGKFSDDQRDIVRERLAQGLPALAQRVKSLNELVENAGIYVAAPQYPLANAKAAKLPAIGNRRLRSDRQLATQRRKIIGQWANRT